MANAIFYEGLHIAELITAVMAFAFHVVSFYGFFLDQHIDSICQLNFITGSPEGFSPAAAKYRRSAHNDRLPPD